MHLSVVLTRILLYVLAILPARPVQLWCSAFLLLHDLFNFECGNFLLFRYFTEVSVNRDLAGSLDSATQNQLMLATLVSSQLQT